MDSLPTFSCPTCSRQLNVPAAAIGKNIKCPACQSIFKITADNAQGPTVGVERAVGFTVRPRQDAPPRPKAQDEENGEPRRRRDVNSDDDRPRRVGDDDDAGARPRRRAAYEEDEPSPRRARRNDDEDRPRRRDYDDDDERDTRRRRRSNYDDDDDRGNRRQRRFDDAVESVAAPAIALLVTGILEIVISLVLSVIFIITPLQRPEERTGKFIWLLFLGVGICQGIFLIIGAALMKSVKSYAFAMAASVVALIPLTCCFLSTAFGVWGLVVLNNVDVKKAFAAEERD